MRFGLLLMLASAAACGGNGSLTVITVGSTTTLPDVAQLTAAISANGKSDTFNIAPETKSIPPSVVFGIDFDPGITGNVTIHVDAFDSHGVKVASGDGAGVIVIGDRADIGVMLGGGPPIDLGPGDDLAPPPDLTPPVVETPVITAPPFAFAGAAALTAQVTAQAGVAYSWTITNGTITAGAATSSITFTAGSMGTLTLTCNASDATGSAMASVNLDVYSNQIVTTLLDSGAGSLRQAILDTDGAPAGNYAISFASPGVITLASDLPPLSNNNILIDGPGAASLTISGNSQYRVFFASGGTVKIRNLTVANGLAKGGTGGAGAEGGGGGAGMGGGLFVNGGTILLDTVTFSGNAAAGGKGTGTNGNQLGEGGGGGGGFGSDGGPGGNPTGGTPGGGGAIGSGAMGGTGGVGGTTGNGTNATDGGFGAGGGGGGNRCACGAGQNGGNGGNGGFGGGAGGAYNGGTAGTAGTFGGAAVAGGGGGAGLGGALFMRAGTITLNACTFDSNSAAGGAALAGAYSPGSPGKGKGGAVFLNAGVVATHGGTLTFTNNTATDASGSSTDTNDLYGTIN